MARTPCRVSYRRELVEAMDSVFPARWFRQFSSHGNAKWTPQRVFWVSAVMSWQPRGTVGETFEAACAVVRLVRPGWRLGKSLGGFLEARQRLLPEMRQPMRLWLQAAVATHFEDWRVRGWQVFGVDGSRFETCRTVANEAGLGCAGKASTTPQVFQTTLLHIGTGLPWDFRLGPGTDSERRHLDDMRASLPPRSLLTADAGFIGFELCLWLFEHAQAFLLRVGSNVHLLTGLGWVVERDGQTVYLWPKSQRRHRPPLTLRLIVVRDADHQPVYLVTNVFDETALSDVDAAELYRLRWELELYYRSIKQTLGHKALRSRTPTTSLTEQTWNVFAGWVLQLLAARELIAAGRTPASWSAAKSRDRVRRLLRLALTGGACPRGKTFRSTLRTATRDDYRRTCPKTTRHWPRQKEQKPPGPPNLHAATDDERQQAQRLRQATLTRS